jgi:glycosyltransferase involved in cell wall biosynthesis
MPKVSAIIPTYNRSERVREAIKSVLGQSEQDVEIVVIDDGSTDETREVISGFGDARVRYFYKQNGGPASARNLGLAKATGRYIAFLDSDDTWPSDYLEVMLSHLAGKPDFGGAYSSITVVERDGRRVRAYKRPAGKSGWITQDLFQRGFIWPSATVFRASAWEGFFFDERLSKTSEDSDAFLRLSTRVQLLFVVDVEAFHTVSGDSISRAEGVVLSRPLSLERFYFDLGGKRIIPRSTAYRRLSHAYRRVAEDCRAKGQKTAAQALYRRAIHYWPFDLRLYKGWLGAKRFPSGADPQPAWRMPEPLGEPVGPSRFERVQAVARTPGNADKLISNIIFTMNRPLQLDAYLRSLRRHAPTQAIQTYILYKEDLFSEQYAELFEEYADCIVVRERDFHDDLLRLVNEVKTKYVLFGTDDVVYFDFVDVGVIDEVLDRFGDRAFGFSLRLGPENLRAGGDSIEEVPLDKGGCVNRLNWKEGRAPEARYPFELNSTIYRTSLVREITSHVGREHVVLKKVFPAGSARVGFLRRLISMKNFLLSLETFRNPNTLEGYCHRWCKNHKSRLPSYLFFQKLCASAIQINQVNTVVDNPVDGSDTCTVEALNEKYRQGYRFDVRAVEQNRPQTTHVGRKHFQLVKGDLERTR